MKADFTCHTYGGVDSDGKERWWACQGCGSAVEYFCTCWLEDEDDAPSPEIYACECRWSYTHGLNPNNPRAANNEKYRPSWLEEADRFVEVTKRPDVPWLGEN